MKTLERNKKRADEAFIICKQKIEEQSGLEMNLVTAECTFDMNKLLFYFTADGRVDFRELVKGNLRACSVPALSCARSACAMRRR